MKSNFKLYKNLFLSTLTLSAFTVGGGYVIVPLMKKKFVDELGLIDEEEMLNMIVIAQSSPGAMAVNASLLLGYRLGGIIGAICTVLGAVIPPLFIISIIAYFYDGFKNNQLVAVFLKGMQIGAAALIFNVVINMAKKILEKDKIFNIIIIMTAFVASFVFRINVIYIILIAGVLGAFKVFFTQQKIDDMKDSKRRLK